MFSMRASSSKHTPSGPRSIALATARTSAENVCERARVKRDERDVTARELTERVPYVVDADRTHVAQVLGHDDVGRARPSASTSIS